MPNAFTRAARTIPGRPLAREWYEYERVDTRATELRRTIAPVEDRTGTAYPDVPLAPPARAYDVDVRRRSFELVDGDGIAQGWLTGRVPPFGARGTLVLRRRR